ncbi:MAG TPA: hypothetical protein VEH29_07970, partial [Acidimicrobiales bacterium]|nr:hypothetical protein [Acidimicrobiales bacterium]
ASNTAPTTVTFSGVAVATGGTGTAAGASGNLHFSGTLKLGATSGHTNSSYTVTLSGTLKVKG